MKSGKVRGGFGKGGGSSKGGFGGFSDSPASSLSYLTEPSDYSSVSDPNVVIALKSFQKRDAATRQRGLEELSTYTLAHPHEKDGGVEDAVLELWGEVYPRLAIDNSRRIRELAHTVQFQLFNSARKRAQKQIPKIVGTWLAGTFDKDKGVSKAATDGLKGVFTNDDKILQFWKKCQTQILEYAKGALNETVDTLSDERNTSPDEAATKYHRVMSYSRALILGLLERLDTSETEPCEHLYRDYFENENVWAGVLIADVALRRQTCQLLGACVENRFDQVQADAQLISKFFIAEGLKSSQSGSAPDLLAALTTLTEKIPSVWTSAYGGKKSVVSRLKAFMEQGSQGSSGSYWTALSDLLKILPSDALPSDAEGLSKILQSLRTGVASELRMKASDAWICYIEVTKLFLGRLPEDEKRLEMIQRDVFPLFEAYLYPTAGLPAWSSGSIPIVLIKAYTLTTTYLPGPHQTTLRREWSRLQDVYKQHLRNSSPEASKDHAESQQKIATEGDRWFSLIANILVAHTRTKDTTRPIPDLVSEASIGLIQDSLEILQTRNWKTFGAAATIESACKNASQLFAGSSTIVGDILETLRTAFSESMPVLLQTQSAKPMLSALCYLAGSEDHRPEISSIWGAAVTSLLQAQDQDAALAGLITILSTKTVSPTARSMDDLQAQLLERCLTYAAGDVEAGRSLLQTVVTFDIFTDEIAQKLVKQLVSQIIDGSGKSNGGIIKALNIVAMKNSALLLQDETTHVTMMTALLSVSEREGAQSEAAELHELLQGGKSSNSRVLSLIQSHINTIEPDSLSVDTLVQQASMISGQIEKTEFQYLLPDLGIWKNELTNILLEVPNPSLAFTGNLGGAYFLVPMDDSIGAARVKRDQTGCSIPGRMAQYSTKLLISSSDLFHEVSAETCAEIMMLLGVTAELAGDQITVNAKNSVWASTSSEALQTDAEELTSSVRKAIMKTTEGGVGWRDGSASVNSSVTDHLIRGLLAASRTFSPLSLYSAKVLSHVIAFLTEFHGFTGDVEQWLAESDLLKSSPTAALPTVAVLSGMGAALASSKLVNNFCNRLVSDLAGAKLEQERTMIALVLFNACAEVYPAGELPVANNRLVFAVRQICSWLDTPDAVTMQMSAEICRSLRYLLPCIKEVYGAYWEKAIDLCLDTWSKQPHEPLNARLAEVHASLRLMSTLETLEEPNDDLIDALQTSEERRSAALITLLQAYRQDHTQALEIVDAMISRRANKIPLAHLKNISDFYGMLANESRTLQTTAFMLLHRALPFVQESQTMDILLEKKTARLPDELLSLLLEPPTLEAYTDEQLAKFPTLIRSYLLTWHIIFDTFEAVPHKMRADYLDQLKQANYIGPLLDFTFDVLGHSAAHAINLDREGFTPDKIRDYDLQIAESEVEEKNMQWLLIHLFYCTLKYVPSLFKTWFNHCKSKQTTIAVDSWLVKYYSPLIIADTLDSVDQWASNQDIPSEEEELNIKISRNTKDIYVGYPVDEVESSISIRLPHNFPLDNVTVNTVNRAAASERKWNAWLLVTQGVIAFSSGNIVDGIMAFRRNVVSTLAGFGECAICYSFISSDGRVPEKKCKTCKQTFHKNCLLKWFQTSSNNTCPLCRTAWEGADIGRSKRTQR